ncbi:DM13 domain-containing protein [Schaalia sp. Marseille-Q2122]|uniref:DM13 domain-containing protein n=1 Tax=Schaalia sp. Marseille-Q2122 TaxID=2736604 RepID=UPI001C376CF1|nr:DM13 domain-containing protein [Schaalia sp. Marseille-Q2122]
MTTMQPQPEKPQDEQHSSPRVKRRRTLIALGAGALVLFAIAMAVFQPWLLFVNTEINDEIPTATAPQSTPAPAAQPQSSQETSSTEGAPSTPTTPAPAPEPQAPAGPALIAQGSLISHEHETSGQVSIFRLPDGSHQLALEGLETTTGPDVHVWLSQAPVIEGFDGWFTAANYDHLDLGELKGNRGNQVYAIPADATIEDWTSITLWCEAFSVSFGAAELRPVN